MERLAVVTGILLSVLCLASSDVNAQACGRYYVSVSVQDLNGKPIKDASVMLRPITVDETKGEQFSRDKADASAFSTSFSEGHSFKEFHKVVVTAKGYRTAENQIKVLSCQSRKIIVKLAPAGSPNSAVWQFDNNVFIQAVGPDGKGVENAELTVIDEKKNVAPQEMKYGFASFDLPNGKYTFRIHADGYLNKQMEADLTTVANFDLKVQLMPEGAEPRSTSKLTGTIFDAVGAVIPGAEVTAIDATGQEFKDLSDESGVYELVLPYNKYSGPKVREAKYDIIVRSNGGFRTSETKGFVFIPSQFGSMHLDIALEIAISG